MTKALSVVAVCLFAGPAWTQAPPRLEEIEVTAQRRPESVHRVAAAIAVLAPDELRNAGVTKPQELTELEPSLQAAASAAPISVYYLRGAGNFTGNALTDSAVAFNVDGVFIGRPHATAGFFYDLTKLVGGFAPEVLDALWELVWAGEVTNDSLQPLRSLARGGEPDR